MKQLKAKTPQLSSSDIKAIVTAFQLISFIKTDSLAQFQRNQIATESALFKLTNHVATYSAEELRVIFVAIGFALDYISGQSTEPLDTSEIDAELSAGLRKNFFIYNRLYPHFSRIVDEIESHM